MTFFEACKAFFTPEERVKRHLTKAQVIARNANYTILPGVVQDVITAFEKGYEQDREFPDWVGLPSNDDDMQGMYQYLIWSARKSGWSSDKLHYIETMYSQARDMQDFHRMLQNQTRRVRNFSNPDDTFEAVPMSVLNDESFHV